jgi:hypothetical protein
MDRSIKAGVAALLALLALASSAHAAVPFKAIASAGPLTSIAVGNELSCQVSHVGDALFEVFPSSTTPGDCGTFVLASGALFSPALSLHDRSAASGIGPATAFTPVSQSEVTGAGTSASPYRLTTVVTADAAGLRLTEVDSYVIGQESYRTDVTIANVGAAPQTGVLYRAADCYLQESDVNYGFVDPSHQAPGCSTNPNNTPPARIEQWFPITPGAQFTEDGFSTVWQQIGAHVPFPNTCQCAARIDNGAGLSWSFALPPGASATYSHFTTFSPTGLAGAPPAAAPAVFGANGIVQAPSNRRCVSRRHFRIRVRSVPGIRVIDAVIFVNNHRVRTLHRRRIGAFVDLRGLPRGTFSVRIVALTGDGRTLRGTRVYHTCAARRRGGRPPI